MKPSLFCSVKIVLIVFALGACSTVNPIVSEWRNPGYGSASFKRIMVGGPGGETSVRRNFEDEFMQQLRAAGIDALPSYRYLSGDEKPDENRLKEAALKAGADALIFARSVRVEQKTQVGPSNFPSTSVGVFGSHVGAGWYGLGDAPSVYRYNEYVSETTLYDVVKNEVVWTGTIRTVELENAPTAIKTYVETVIKELAEKNLVRKQSGPSR